MDVWRVTEGRVNHHGDEDDQVDVWRVTEGRVNHHGDEDDQVDVCGVSLRDGCVRGTG